MSFVVTPRFICVCLWVGTALALTSCGEDRQTGTGTSTTGTTGTETEKSKATAPVAATIEIAETDFKLNPANPRVRKPGVVEFVATNKGKALHALEVEGPGGEAETKTIQPGRSARLKVDLSKPGSYTMYCPVGDHEQRGMTGKVTVAGGSGGSGGGTDTDKSGSRY
jgi:uncharacterized cupredoxin-like copper-binding protein